MQAAGALVLGINVANTQNGPSIMNHLVISSKHTPPNKTRPQPFAPGPFTQPRCINGRYLSKDKRLPTTATNSCSNCGLPKQHTNSYTHLRGVLKFSHSTKNDRGQKWRRLLHIEIDLSCPPYNSLNLLSPTKFVQGHRALEI